MNSRSKSNQSSLQLGGGSGNIVSSFEEFKKEFWRVSWTEKQELKQNVKIVVLSVFVFSMLIYASDLLLQLGLKGIAIFLKVLF